MRFRPTSSLPAALLHLLFRLVLNLALPALLTACGNLPEPFLGNPGATARRLAMPETPPMLAVLPPSNALLSAQAKDDFADLLALDLQKEEVPTLARKPEKTDWRLAVSAQVKGDLVVPHYAILDPSGHEQGAIDGAAFAASAWTSGAPGTLGQAAQDATPKILALMMSIRRTRDRANPNSLVNRVAKLYVPIVTGAPGDGNTALTKLIRSGLSDFGPLVQVTPEGADFTVTGTVTVTPLPKGQQQVEIAWTVTRPDGKLVGKVSQLNAVPAGTLDGFWGDVAGVVAQEASGGINAVVDRFIGRDETASGKATNSGERTQSGKAAASDATKIANPGIAATKASAAQEVTGTGDPKASPADKGSHSGAQAGSAGTGDPKASLAPDKASHSGAQAGPESNP